jgi:hypothetical protein
MDSTQIASFVVTVASGAAGALSMAKVYAIMETRRAAKLRAALAAQQAAAPKLFPNGERDEIIQRIDFLSMENRERRREHDEMRITLNRICERLNIER